MFFAGSNLKIVLDDATYYGWHVENLRDANFLSRVLSDLFVGIDFSPECSGCRSLNIRHIKQLFIQLIPIPIVSITIRTIGIGNLVAPMHRGLFGGPMNKMC